MNLKIISEELKTNFSKVLSDLPLDSIKYVNLPSFIRYYKRLYFNLYKQFGIEYATDILREIGPSLVLAATSISLDEDFSYALRMHARNIFKALERDGMIDHSKHNLGLCGGFYDELSSLEREIYLSSFIDDIAGSGAESPIVAISKTCLRLNITLETYCQCAYSISNKSKKWSEVIIKDMNGDAIRF